MKQELFSIANGVDGIFIENKRFNTTVISFNYYLPLIKEDVAANALLPYVLTSCSEEYENLTVLNRKFNMLYGADLSLTVNKTGDNHHVRIAVSVINDRFSFDNTSIICEAVNLILSLIFKPRLLNGSFYAEDVEREKRKMVENILGEINEKRVYAKNRTLSLMYAALPSGLSRFGELDDVKKLSGVQLYDAWQRMLNTAYVRVQVIGEKLPNNLFQLVGQHFSQVERKPFDQYKKVNTLAPSNTVNRVTDKMDVAQGKLVMGFSSETHGNDCYKLSVTSDIFGGGPYSRLFTNVREKMSLCYYCSASSVMTKGHLLVESGVEFQNMEKAEKEILNQLSAVKNGEFDDFTFEASIKSICGSLKSYNDSLAALDGWYASRIFGDKLISPNDAAKEISKITKQDVIETAKGIQLHTVYKLVGGGSCDE